VSTRVVTALSLFLATTMVPLLAPVTGTAASMIIAGNGPERPTIERLARVFEKRHLGSVVEIQWEQDSDPTDLVKSGEAHVAVTGQTAPDLTAIPIAWDGIAVVVDSTNPVKEVTTQQVADIFAGKVRRWCALGGPDTTIQLIDRPPYQHIRHRFLEALGIVGNIPKSAPRQIHDYDDVCIEAFSSSMALATSPSVDPNRSPITLMACLIAVVIFVICSSGVIEFLLVRNNHYRQVARRPIPLPHLHAPY